MQYAVCLVGLVLQSHFVHACCYSIIHIKHPGRWSNLFPVRCFCWANDLFDKRSHISLWYNGSGWLCRGGSAAKNNKQFVFMYVYKMIYALCICTGFTHYKHHYEWSRKCLDIDPCEVCLHVRPPRTDVYHVCFFLYNKYYIII